MRKKELIKINEELFQRLEEEKLNFKKANEKNIELEKQIQILRDKVKLLEEKTPEEEPKAPEAPEEIILENDLEYGAKIIGKIVFSSAEFCNQLSSPTPSESTKELINLCLGRTEVAKAEIHKIISSEASLNNKIAMMDSELAACTDYFNSLKAQTL